MRQGESLSRSERRQQFVNTRPFEEDICSSSSCNNSCCCYCCCCQLHLATFSANAMTQFVATTFHMSLVAVAQPPPSPQQIPIDLEADRTLSHSHSSHPSPVPSCPYPSSLHLPHTDLHALCAASFPVGIFCFASQPQPQPASLSRRLLRLRRGIAIMCHQLCQLLHMPQHKRNNTKLCETLCTVLGWCLPHATLVCHRFALVASNLGFHISIYSTESWRPYQFSSELV